MNPYVQDVAQSTSNLLGQNNAQAQSGALGTAIQSGAFGGDRTGIAAANLQQQQNLSNANIYSGILSQGYQNAQGVAQQQQGVGLAAGQANRAALANAGQEIAGIGQTQYGESANTAAEQGSLASGAQTAGLQGANAQIAAGTVQQQTQQAQDTAEYNQFLQQQSYPFQIAQFEANIAEGTGALSGSTTTTQQPGGFFSDKRLKHDIKKIGETFDAQDIYSYKMHGDPRTHIGLIAQKVEKKHPDAVGLAAGYKTVDYGRATEEAANRGHFYAGGVVPIRRAYAGGGPSIVGPADYSAILAAQQQMYAPRSEGAGVYGGAGGSIPGGGSKRVPPPSGSTPHLVTAEGGLKPRETGAQNVSGLMDLVKQGQDMYREDRPVRHTVTTTTPGGLAPAATDDTPDMARGGVAGRRGYDDGGSADDLSAVLQAQQNMYRPMQHGRDIPNQSHGTPQLAVASGSPSGGGGGSSGVSQGLGLAQKGYQAYKHFNPSTPPATGATPNGVSAGDLSGQATQATAPAADSSSVSGIAPTSGAGLDAGAADAGATEAAGAGAAEAAGSGAAADAAAGAAAGAGAGAATGAAAETAAAIAAEEVAAAAAVAAVAAKRGGRIRKGLAAGGIPYEDGTAGSPYGSSDGSLDIPDTENTAKLASPGPLVKRPTGLQTLEKLGTQEGAQGAMSGMFSNEALARGGVAGRRGYDDGGDVDPTDDGPPTPDVPTVRKSEGVKPAELKMDSGPGWWDRNKGKVIPALTGLAAMGTAPTRSWGTALAAGLGAGARAYVPENQGLASTRQTETETKGIDIQNQMKQQTLDLYKQSIGGLNKPQPTTAARSKPNPLITPLSIDDATGYYQDKYKYNPNITPQDAANIAKLKNVDAMAHTNLSAGAQLQAENNVKQGMFTVQNAAQRDHDKLMIGVVHAADTGDSAYTNLKQINPGLAAQVAAKAGLDSTNQDSWTTAQKKLADTTAAQIAAQHATVIHQYTGAGYAGANAVDERTNVPAAGPAAAQLGPEARSHRQLALAQPTVYGAGLPEPLGKAAGIADAPPGVASQSATAQPPQRAPVRPTTTTAPAAAAPQDPVLAKALADPKYNAAPIPTPTDQVSLQNSKDLQKARTETATNLQQDAEQAAQSSGSALQFALAAKQIMDSKGAPTVGLFGPAMKAATSVFGGVDATNYQEVAKYLGNLAVQSGKGNFPHATEKENMMQFNELSPGVNQTGDALKDLLNTNINNIKYTLDTANRTTDFLDPKNKKDPQKFFRWNQENFPRENAVNPPEESKSKSGRPVIKVNGRWEYKQ